MLSAESAFAFSRLIEDVYATSDVQAEEANSSSSLSSNFSSSLPEEESIVSDPGDLVSEPIDILRPKGNALLLTAEELQKALSRHVRTREHLEEYAKALVQTDNRVRRVEIGESGVRMVYRQKAKFLGLVPLSYYLETTIDARGKLHIGKPWWLFLAPDRAKDIEQNLQSLIIEDKLILGNLMKISDVKERGLAVIEMLVSITRKVYESQTSF